MRKIALTGNIGSGKSYIADLIEGMGIPVFRADEAGRRLYSDPEVIEEVKQGFGAGVLDGNGQIDRKLLAELVFSNQQAMRELSELIHPRVMKLFNDWSASQQGDMVVMESAIIYEYGLEGQFDMVVLVRAPLGLRLERVMKRDGVSREDVLARMNSQWPEDWKADLAQAVIWNDGRELEEQLLAALSV